ncbi:MAG: M48 family metalloprotease [Phycisphaerales bacterium]|nr:M48 family metalloprotease [Phycisphaerales bacterium]MCB9840046.1 M48 family metalloprotease [Phycisphaeraceae bacterium]
MMQMLVIAAVVAMNAAGQGPAAALALPAAWVALLTLVPPWMVWGLSHAVCAVAGRGIDRTGNARLVVLADRVSMTSRAFSCLWLGGTALTLGWIAQAGDAMGSHLLAVVAGAALLSALLTASWWSYAGIDRRLREAAMMRHLDEGRPIFRHPGPAGFALARLRESALMFLVPVLLLLAISSGLAWLTRALRAGAEAGSAWAAWVPAWALDTGSVLNLDTVLQTVGFIAALALMPAVQRRIWDTVRLEHGPLLGLINDLLATARVRLRRIMVWRTRGLTANAAVLGVVPRFRYMIFTDALLEGMTGDEVGAVAAHEIGHVKHHHIPWLLAGMGAVLLLIGEIAARWAVASGMGDGAAELVALGAALAIGLPIMGWISRRFEWQADAFAAALLSRVRERQGVPEARGVIDQASARLVAQALLRVARLNGADPAARSWRHGSINLRRRKAAALAGVDRRRVPADRAAQAVKIGILGVWVVLVLAQL